MLKQGFRNPGLGLGAVLAAVLLAGSTGHASAQSPAAPGGGPQEGIQVHGDWVIEVRDPDGRLADRREFKNALTTGGRALAGLLGRNLSAGYWVIWLNKAFENEQIEPPCRDVITSAPGCGIYENLDTGQNFPNVSRSSSNLQVNLLPDRVKLQLTGSVTATNTSTIGRVSTTLRTCNATSAPATPCQSTGLEWWFSDTQSFTPVPVVSGQIIQVTVTFSFS